MLKSPISFTPGPWKIRPVFTHGYHNSNSIVGLDGKVVATTGQAWRRGRKERDANAKLIALAPELFESLVNLMESFPSTNKEGAVAAYRKAIAVFAKFEGKTEARR